MCVSTSQSRRPESERRNEERVTLRGRDLGCLCVAMAGAAVTAWPVLVRPFPELCLPWPCPNSAQAMNITGL